MRRWWLGIVLLVVACRKTPVVDDMQGLHDTGAGWMPDAYEPLLIPPTAPIARKWSADPARHATWAREPSCEIAKICDDDGFAYRATNADGATLFVTYNGELGIRRAEVTKDGAVRAFEPVYVPTLPYLLLEVERATATTGGERLVWRREPNVPIYDPYRQFQQALRKESNANEAGRLVESYVTAFGIGDGRLVREAYDRPDRAWRTTVIAHLCATTMGPYALRSSPFYREHRDPARVKELQRFYAELVAAESAPEVLTGAFQCFVHRDAFVPERAEDILGRIVRAACTATSEEAWEAASGAMNLYPKWSETKESKDIALFMERALQQCPAGPKKEKLAAYYLAAKLEQQTAPNVPW